MAGAALVGRLRIGHGGKVAAAEILRAVDAVDHEGQVGIGIYGGHVVDVVAVDAGLDLGEKPCVADVAEPGAVAFLAGGSGHHVGAGGGQPGPGGGLQEVVGSVDGVGEDHYLPVDILEPAGVSRHPDDMGDRRQNIAAGIGVFAGRRIHQGQGARQGRIGGRRAALDEQLVPGRAGVVGGALGGRDQFGDDKIHCIGVLSDIDAVAVLVGQEEMDRQGAGTRIVGNRPSEVQDEIFGDDIRCDNAGGTGRTFGPLGTLIALWTLNALNALGPLRALGTLDASVTLFARTAGKSQGQHDEPGQKQPL